MSDAVGRHAVALASVHELGRAVGRAARGAARRRGRRAARRRWSSARRNELELTEAGITQPVAPGEIGQVAPAVLPDLTPVPA